MTILRSLAVRLSGFVERHASVGSREWAEGLAREVEFIEGDWKALGWALSSLPVLVDRRERPLRSLQDVPALAQKLGADSSYMAGSPAWTWLFAPGFVAITMCDKLLRATSPSERVGYGLAMCGWIIVGVVTYIGRSRRKERQASPAGDWTLLYPGDLGAWALYYKSELEFRLERMRSPLVWLCGFAVLLVCTGLSITEGPFATHTVFMVALELSIVPLVLYLRNKIRGRLDRLNTLLAASEEEGI